ncbi:MAG TPA: hypothetical protein VFQ47_03845 [Nitrososphaera sp.]|jgi:hypothetical protein|nr:hypothetical protein [Nitrososphaera sp.]
MADQPSIFGNTPNTDTNPNPAGSNPAPAPQDDVATLLSAIKNERGEPKYSDLNTALRALQASQEFIPSLKSQYETEKAEAQRLREEVSRLRTIEETVAALSQRQPEAPGTPPAVGLTEGQIAELVNRTLTQKERETVQQTNIQTVVSSLQQSFGADAEKKYNAKAQELGMTMEEMNTLASKSPKAVLSMLGVSGQPAPKQTTFATQSSVNTSAFQPQPESYVGRNPNPTLIGATSQDLHQESQLAKKMVDELHAQGMSVYDLTDPKVYFKHFRNNK